MIGRPDLAPGIWVIASALCGFSLQARAEETHKVQILDILSSASVAPNMRAIAGREGFPMSGIQFGPAGETAGPGDTVSALVVLSSFDGRLKPRQWMIRLRLASMGSAGTSRDLTFHTNVGDTFLFHSATTAMDLETMGPVQADSSAQARVERRRTRIAVNTDFLTLDLNRTASVLFRLKQQEQKSPGLKYLLSAGPSPYPAGDWEADRQKLAGLGVTEDDRRSFTGSLPALMQFLDIARSTPGLQEILLEVLDKPSVIDVFRHAGRADLNFNFIGGGPSVGRENFWKDASDRAFGGMAFELTVFGRPALNVALFLTPPRPPLEVSAGILAVIAWSPSKPDKVVVIRVLSAIPGASQATPPPPIAFGLP
jgi:hypothetical protein